MSKIEYSYCLKCGSLIELVYLPGMSRVTIDLFDRVKYTGLCCRCLDSTVNEPVKQYLH